MNESDREDEAALEHQLIGAFGSRPLRADLAVATRAVRRLSHLLDSHRSEHAMVANGLVALLTCAESACLFADSVNVHDGALDELLPEWTPEPSDFQRLCSCFAGLRGPLAKMRVVLEEADTSAYERQRGAFSDAVHARVFSAASTAAALGIGAEVRAEVRRDLKSLASLRSEFRVGQQFLSPWRDGPFGALWSEGARRARGLDPGGS